MLSIEKSLLIWQKQNFDSAYKVMNQALEEARQERDVVKQKYCAEYFDISVNTLKSWVQQGCPEIRLNSGMVLYSKKEVREWLLQFQK